MFGLAGITELWSGPEGPIHTVCLVTTEPDELMQSIHDRMPVIIPASGYSDWLDPANQNTARLQSFIAPYPAGLMTACPASTRITTRRCGNDQRYQGG